MRVHWRRIFIVAGWLFLIYLLVMWYRDPQDVFRVLLPERLESGGTGNPWDVSILVLLVAAAALAAAWGGKPDN